MNELKMIVIYADPADYPGGFVAREWFTSAKGQRAGRVLVMARSLDVARAAIPKGMFRFDRAKDDDPSVLEVWL